MSWSCTLHPAYPLVGQLQSGTADGQPSENQNFDCFEANCAALVAWITGCKPLDPDTMNSLAFWNGHVGVTSIAKAQSFLSGQWAIPTIYQFPTAQLTGPGSLTYLIWSSLVNNLPVLAVRMYSPSVPTEHFISVVGIDPSTITYMQSYGTTGTLVTESYQDFFDAFMLAPDRCLLAVTRPRDAWLPQV